jgi:fructose-1,6-bisphosphatase/inositol monophosphatase family enzyme
VTPARDWLSMFETLTQAIDREWRAAGHLTSWLKNGDGSPVSGFDIRLDVALREVLADRCPGVSVLSEELGWLHPNAGKDECLVAVVDPVDGTESLVSGQTTWWTAIGFVSEGLPVAGLLYQPVTGRRFDSSNTAFPNSTARQIALSPGSMQGADREQLAVRLAHHGLEVAEVPHAVAKVAAVLEGRCIASVYLPSMASPVWHSWDLAACLAIAKRSEVVLRSLDGAEIDLDDLDKEYDAGWICARDASTWQLVARVFVS